MSEFTNVTVVREANIYFGGAVASHTVVFADGSKKTLGVMQPGEYTFNTGAAELMEILSGELDLQLAGETGWRPIAGGQSFEVPANSSFTMKVKTVSDYCCSFLA
ncbi:pyrimidine/purine nucleoside phosphorylase [Trichlorobacter ammonificans]|uniref:Pyrimidine/purine nucleoside phosphorylase n=1 Tax=Trichlorobacter ammonificans TaxID=2916410 RepID=A0ABM9D8I4_9BACT|nr:pyrimidine/purine nucleoside phosphorylase [Trichlorobacter ammonificans]CAH2031520.1 Pyrimidine/purine nucleoside phosphorylase [Trichlorobacter ammonificans]